jgi:hypothetical protein
LQAAAVIICNYLQRVALPSAVNSYGILGKSLFSQYVFASPVANNFNLLKTEITVSNENGTLAVNFINQFITDDCNKQMPLTDVF